MSEANTGASLRFFTDEPDTDFIGIALSAKPSCAFRKGEPRSKRNPLSSKFEQSLWFYESPLPDTSELHEHVAHIATFLEAHEAQLASIRSRITMMDIFGLFDSCEARASMRLNAPLLRRLARQRIGLTIDLYPPESRMNPLPPEEPVENENEKSAFAWLGVFVSEGGTEWIPATLRTNAPLRDEKKGTSPTAPAGSLIWLHQSTLPDSFPVEDHVANVLDFLQSKCSAWNAIRNRVTEVEIFSRYGCVHGQGSAGFSPALLDRLAALNIGLGLELCEHPEA